MARLCAATHVKNEQYLIAGWCDAHRMLAQELLVIDTGSTDMTVTIAEQSGAHIRHADIEAGFDVVRTFCIEQAAALGCEWVLILDADERVFGWLPELALRHEETPINMAELWPAGSGAPTHARYEAIRTGRMIYQAAIIRQAIEDLEIVAYRTRRRHWFDWNMTRPCQSWRDWDDPEGVPDWQNRFCRTDRGLKYVRKVHEWLRLSDGSPPEPQGGFGPDGPFFDHFHVPAKRLNPGRAEEVSALCSRLYEGDQEYKGTY